MAAGGTRTRTSTIIAGLVACGLAVAMASCDATKSPTGPDISVSVAPEDITFSSLREAAERGAIDPELVDVLEQGKAVDAFAILDGAAVREAYADGNVEGVRKAGELVAALRTQVTAAVGVEVLTAYQLLPEVLVRLTDAPLALRLLNLREVLSITQDHQNVTQTVESLPLIGQPRLNAMGLNGAGVTVAVLDTGADLTQAQFGPCTAPGMPAGTCRVPVAFDAAPDDGVADTTGHGTNVAAIVASVATAAQIIPIDVHVSSYAWDHDVLSGLDWVLVNRAKYNIRAVNMSFGEANSYHTNGCGDNPFWRNAFSQPFSAMRQARILPVIAAGNFAITGGTLTNNVITGGTFHDGISWPSCTAGAIAVGATYDSSVTTTLNWGGANPQCSDVNPPVDTIACISQDAPQLDVLAPGARITAGGTTRAGTSQAAPHVSGAVALLAQANPTAGADQIESAVKSSSVTITDSRAGSAGRSHPRLDLASALRAAVPVPNDNRAAATTLSGWGGRLEQVTWAATKESGEPSHAGNVGGASVWFTWTAPRAGGAVFSTAGSGFDTVMAAYAPGSVTPLASHDGPGASLIQLPVNAGDVLHIAVDGDRSVFTGLPGTGRLRLTWNLPNDALGEAWPITPGTPEAGSNLSATHEIGEPHHCGDTFATASVWYRWAPSADATARIRASGAKFLCVAVYRTAGGPSPAPSLSQLIGVAGGADDSGPPVDFTFTATAGSSYWIAVDGVSVETGCSPTTGQCTYTTPTGTFQLNLTIA